MRAKRIPTTPGLRKALSFPELLAGVVILAILAALVIPASFNFLRKGQSASCLQRLRQISPIFHAYAADHQNQVRFLRDGSGLMWFTALREHANLSLDGARRSFGCPSRPWQESGPWVCYGMRLGYLTIPDNQDPGYPIIRYREGEHPDFKGGTYGFSIAAIENPSKFLLLADSAGPNGSQTFRLAGRTLYSGGGICLRHQGRANALFLDGHSEALDLKTVLKMGFTEALDAEGNILTEK